MPNKETPLVSVLMTAYNREQFIAEAIESVLSSTYQNFELIIVDDGSKDSTVSIAKSYAERDNRISVYVNEKNLGDYPNRNKAASLATGEYIMYVDSDDRIESKGLEMCVNSMIEFPECGIGMYYPYDLAPFKLDSVSAIYKHFFEKPFLGMGPGGTILNTDFFKNTMLLYPVKYGPANDMYFNIAACSKTSILMIPYKFMFYRLHDNQESKNAFSYLYNQYNYLKDALLELDLPLSQNQKKWIANKNKRRFVMNLVLFFFKTAKFKDVIYAIQKTNFNLKDLFNAIFSGSLK